MRPDVPQHNSDRELIGQGLANLVAPFFGGVPATAALARTAVNVRAGANSRLSAAFHAVVLAIFVLALGGLVAQIPLAGLAGVLIATASHMVRIDELKKTARTSKLDLIVLLSTLVATVMSNLTYAVLVGLLLFILLRGTRLSKRNIPVDDEETLGD